MVELDPAVEQQLADLPDADWRALSARVRPPTSTGQLKEIAGKVLSGAALDAFVSVANPKAFAAENGDVSEERVMGHLTALYATNAATPNYGQGSGKPPGVKAGDNARAALAKRHPPKATPKPDGGPGPGAGGIPPGRGARQELERRYGKGKK